MINLPIVLTVIRMVLTPCIVACMAVHAWLLAFLLVCIAGLTDMLDGSLARALKQETFLGACLDPIADKFLLLTLYISSFVFAAPEFCLPAWFIVLALVREAIILSGAAYLGLMRHDIAIKPTLLSKVTTAVQLIFIGLLFLRATRNMPLDCCVSLIVWVLTGLLVLSGLQYIVLGLQAMRGSRV